MSDRHTQEYTINAYNNNYTAHIHNNFIHYYHRHEQDFTQGVQNNFYKGFFDLLRSSKTNIASTL